MAQHPPSSLLEIECPHHRNHCFIYPLTKCYFELTAGRNAIIHVVYFKRPEDKESLSRFKVYRNLLLHLGIFQTKETISSIPLCSALRLARTTNAQLIWNLLGQLLRVLRGYDELHLINLLLNEKKYFEYLELCLVITIQSKCDQYDSYSLEETNTFYCKKLAESTRPRCSQVSHFEPLALALCTSRVKKRVRSGNQSTEASPCKPECRLKNRVSRFDGLNLSYLHRLLCEITPFRALPKNSVGFDAQHWRDSHNQKSLEHWVRTMCTIVPQHAANK